MSNHRMTGEVGPIRTPNRFLTHPFEYGFAFLFLVVGVGLFLSRFQVRISPVQTLPIPIVVAWAVALTLGGPLIMAGLSWRGIGHTGRALERAGLYLVTGAWVTYTVVVLTYAPSLVVSIAQGFIVSAACALRALALSKVDRAVEHIAQVVADDAEE